MKKLLFSLFLLLSCASFGQDVDALRQTAREFLQQGDYDNAILVLTKAQQSAPTSLEVGKDLLFANYLKRDFAKALEIGKPLAERSDADVQSFQMLGMVYKSIAEDKEAEKLYKLGMKKFPKEGILYADYGDLLAAKDPTTAIGLWEKGIQIDPNNPGNYYYAAKYYSNDKDALWSVLYGEMFLNMESFTERSTEMKNILLDQYKKFFVGGVANAVPDRKNAKPFTLAVADVLLNQSSVLSQGVTPESLTMVRTRFILEWYSKYAKNYNFRLFEHQRQLLQEGLFDAYNTWLFGPAANLSTYQTWQEFHGTELNDFLSFIRSKVFKVSDDAISRNAQ